MTRKVAILDAQAIQAVPVIKSALQAGFQVVIYSTTRLCGAWSLPISEVNIVSNDCYSDKNFISIFVDRVMRGDFNLILAMNDSGIIFLQELAELHDIRQYFPYNEREVFYNAVDKARLMRFCERNSFAHPKTLHPKALDELGNTGITFPILIKPNISTGARGIKAVDSYDALQDTYKRVREEYGDVHLQEMIIQGSRQIKVQLYVTRQKKIMAVTTLEKLRFFPVNGGSSTTCVSIENGLAADQCMNVARALGWIGFMDFDLIEDQRSGEYKIIEINPRMPACIKAASISGVDYTKLILAEWFKVKYEPEYLPGKTLRYLTLDTLWLINSIFLGKSISGWFSFNDSNTYYQDGDKDNFLCFILCILGALKNLMSISFIKRKFF